MTKKRKNIYPLTEKQFVNFLKFVSDNDEVFAVRCFLDEIEEGLSVDEILAGEKPDKSVILLGNPDPYVVKVTKLDKFKFKIYFGCFPAPLAGDSGTWEVSFDEDGNVKNTIMVVHTII